VKLYSVGISRIALSLFTFACFLTLDRSAWAQDVPLGAPAGFEKGADLSLGGFAFFNRIQTGLQATNNIRQDPTEEEDLKTLFEAAAVARSTWKEHALAFTASHVRQNAVETDDQSSSASSGTISGRYDFSKNLNVTGGLLHIEDIVGKNDPNQFSGNLNGTTVTDTIEGALNWQGQDYFVSVDGRFNEVDNTTDLALTVVSRIQQQNRAESIATVQIGKKYPWGKAYIVGGAQRYHYSGSDVILPEDRDSQGARGGVGLEFQSGAWQGIFRVFGFAQYFDAPTIGHTIDVVGTGQLIWNIDDKVGMAGKVERNFEEVNIETSAGLFTNIASVGLRYQFHDDAYLKLGPTYRFYQIEGTTVEAESYTFDATVAWQVHERVELLLNASIANQLVNDSLISELQYDEAIITISTVITF
jgi:hypothetical protein